MNVTVPQTFICVVPSAIVIFSLAVLRMLIVTLRVSKILSDLINELLQGPFSTNSDAVGTALLYNTSTHLTRML